MPVIWATQVLETLAKEGLPSRAEDGGFIFLTTKRLSQSDDGITLTEYHESKPQGMGGKLSIPMRFQFRGAIKNTLLVDLDDIKSAVERKPEPTTKQ